MGPIASRTCAPRGGVASTDTLSLIRTTKASFHRGGPVFLPRESTVECAAMPSRTCLWESPAASSMPGSASPQPDRHPVPRPATEPIELQPRCTARAQHDSIALQQRSESQAGEALTREGVSHRRRATGTRGTRTFAAARNAWRARSAGNERPRLPEPADGRITRAYRPDRAHGVSRHRRPHRLSRASLQRAGPRQAD